MMEKIGWEYLDCFIFIGICIDKYDVMGRYLLGGLFLLKMYQSRHADISPNAQLSYAVFAFWIFLAVIGVVIDKQWFWTAFAVVLIIGSIPVGIQMYYMGSWKFDLCKWMKFYPKQTGS